MKLVQIKKDSNPSELCQLFNKPVNIFITPFGTSLIKHSSTNSLYDLNALTSRVAELVEQNPKKISAEDFVRVEKLTNRVSALHEMAVASAKKTNCFSQFFFNIRKWSHSFSIHNTKIHQTCFITRMIFRIREKINSSPRFQFWPLSADDAYYRILSRYKFPAYIGADTFFDNPALKKFVTTYPPTTYSPDAGIVATYSRERIDQIYSQMFPGQN